MNRAEDVEQIRKTVQDAAGIEIPETEHAAIRAARVVRKDGFQRRMSLRGRAPLFSGKAGDADHSDLAVRPGLLRDPFDQVVVVGVLVAIVPF
jgi:hypothetical protein